MSEWEGCGLENRLRGSTCLSSNLSASAKYEKGDIMNSKKHLEELRDCLIRSLEGYTSTDTVKVILDLVEQIARILNRMPD